MRLARRLSVAISLGICLVLGGNAWLRISTERQTYREDVRRDHRAFGRGLAAALEVVWLHDGKAVALEAVEQFNLRENHIAIRWVWPSAEGADTVHAPRVPNLMPRAGERTRSEVVLAQNTVAHMLTYVSVDIPGGGGGALELYESLAREQAALRRILWRAGITLTILVGLCVGLTFGFGVLFVARPLRALGAQADRIGAGDLSTPLTLTEDNEIRDLAIGMNVMCERLSELRARTEHEIQARVRALEQLRHADRLRTVGELASGIAHQLGTPLNVVRARGAMIAGGEVPEARMRELGKVIVDHVDRMSATIRQLLDFARREQPQFSSGDLIKTIEQTIKLVEPLANQGRVTLRFTPNTATLPLQIDSGQLHQAFTNILVNALHATPEGGRVQVSVIEEADAFVVEVLDGGQGIASEHLAHIFEPFYTTKPAGEGTGLGLSVADGIVREHGGSIEAGSHPERGTVFRVRLPKQPE